MFSDLIPRSYDGAHALSELSSTISASVSAQLQQQVPSPACTVHAFEISSEPLQCAAIASHINSVSDGLVSVRYTVLNHNLRDILLNSSSGAQDDVLFPTRRQAAPRSHVGLPHENAAGAAFLRSRRHLVT